MKKCIKYKSGYKYQLQDDYEEETDIYPLNDINLQFIRLNSDGKLLIKSGYAWDGPSGPTIDTNNFMRGSLVHDALYQLMRDGGLDSEVYRDKADKLLQQICKEDGMSLIRSWWVYEGVHLFGKTATRPDRDMEYAGNDCN